MDSTEQTIDITPTWESLVPVFVMILENANKAGRDAVIADLKRMAQAADKYNELVNGGAA